MEGFDSIKIRGARQNNLKGIDVDIPLNKVTVITGVSGSGKSSLAFDTLYAEGQRRYIETFSPYARQFIDRMDKPQVEKIEGIPPAIAIEQGNTIRTSRSTVGTITELTDFVKLLFPRLAELNCRGCSRKVVRDSPESVWEFLIDSEPLSRAILAFPLKRGDAAPQSLKEQLLSQGFFRVLDGDQVKDLTEEDLRKECTLLVADRFILKDDAKTRIIDSLEQAFRLGRGRIVLQIIGSEMYKFSTGFHCPYCDIEYRDPVPNLFSFNSPLGACPKCRGFGRMVDIDLNQIIPDPYLPIEDGAIRPWGTDRYEYSDLLEFCSKNRIPVDVPFRDLEDSQKKLIIDGSGRFYGVRGFFHWLESKSYKMHVRVFLSRYRAYFTCTECRGSRFTADSLLYRIHGLTISEIYALSIAEASAFFSDLDSLHLDEASRMILREILSRLKYLNEVGLSYLTLDRQSRTLSGGEVQRVSLTKALGSSLVNTLYVLDEPSVGLHARDSRRLLGILKKLSVENTVVVVEHDPEIISGSDYILDLGPGAGENGGRLIYMGLVSEIGGFTGSKTIDYLTSRERIAKPEKRESPSPGKVIRFEGVRANNLKNLSFDLPLGLMVCITGVSGSGKSTLADDIIYKGIRKEKRYPTEPPGEYDLISGAGHIKDVVLVDQSPIGRTPRANPVSYIGALDPIRKLLAKVPLARERGYRPGAFSFNIEGGRCETCRGNGFERVEMQFLSDVYISCPDCDGLRYKKEILEVLYKGESASDILRLTCSEAYSFFSESPDIRHLLEPLLDVGLGYLRLGQPVNTLSGGEAQRLKLAKHLALTSRKQLLFIFDEPTTGLHFDDVKKLLKAFRKLVSAGHSLLIIEHNLDIIKCADYVMDLGPEGGDEGGWIIAQGTPEEIAEVEQSHTGLALRKYLAARIEPCLIGDYSQANPRQQAPRKVISIKGARQHNLKHLDVEIPRDQLVVITGISGSGKSTLAFDIVFAEGQRRYIESLPTYVRQYIKVMERADVDLITGIPPTVAVEQRVSRLHRRSTVATITEIYHYLRLLFSKIGVQYCRCGNPVSPQSEGQILDRIRHLYESGDVLFLSPKIVHRKGTYKEVFEQARGRNYTHVRVDGRILPLSGIPALERHKEHSIDFITAEVSLPEGNSGQLAEAVSLSLQEGMGTFRTLAVNSRQESIFSTKGYCPNCGTNFEPIDPRFFSFNSRHGACPACDGLGVLEEGQPCPKCRGTRLNARALSVRIDNHNIYDITSLGVNEALVYFQTLSVPSREKIIYELILPEILARLDFMNMVGLSYLTLERSGDTLSGGETQRIRLAAQLGSNLHGACYVLDEPTIGLHPRDNHTLIKALLRLKARGSSVLIVEHDEDTILNADCILDLGPGAGLQGGRLIAQGTPEEIRKNPASVTGKWLGNANRHKITSRMRPAREGKWLNIKGASVHNLKDLDAAIPLGVLVCITGVSGSGKSSLLRDILLNGIKSLLSGNSLREGNVREILGWEAIERILEVDHTPIGKTSRSTPGTYIGFYDQIRNFYAKLPESRMRGYGPGRFSFNVKGGRCESCKGEGRIKVEMSFLPDVHIGCEVCNGSRFNAETLSILYKGKSIAEILETSVDEAVVLFSNISKIARPLMLLSEMGLGYLRVGQPSDTLSGGEAQRIKLAYELCKEAHGRTLYILDEPTTGLHLADIEKLMAVLQRLVDLGNTVAVIEHNLEVVKEADYIIDLGPEGGEGGGNIVARGTPLEILNYEAGSYTAQFLKKYLAGQEPVLQQLDTKAV